ncbi:hypothetical protein AND_000136 [Anopheles darlingi]|uniref:Uncharacterized protein n=1 Tax=Anopheles darlingi TaxID=43151 RepID=W5JX42_ANODA|nr:hypothetical protein AND_000136 [Anopheles darlingi]
MIVRVHVYVDSLLVDRITNGARVDPTVWPAMSRSPASAVQAHDHVRMKPEPIPFSKFLFNSQNGTVLGRGAGSWGKFLLSKIGIFYIIFYSVLAALVAMCMWVFFKTLDPRIPKWQVDQSLIGASPGE